MLQTALMMLIDYPLFSSGKNVLNQKSELQRALEKHKEHQVKKEVEQQRAQNKTAFERVIEERARRLESVSSNKMFSVIVFY